MENKLKNLIEELKIYTNIFDKKKEEESLANLGLTEEEIEGYFEFYENKIFN